MDELKEGVKYDKEKPRWDLLPYRETEEVVKVLTFGGRKYADNNWQKLAGGRLRYFAAAMRHMAKYMMGHKVDDESGLSPLAHAACCILFVMWHDTEKTQ